MKQEQAVKKEEVKQPTNHVSGVRLYQFVHAMRRRGITASFGSDVDPKYLRK